MNVRAFALLLTFFSEGNMMRDIRPGKHTFMHNMFILLP